ncbi:hypothetical protein NP233_g12870 [Leucocoprinus birnbaumii]|uniref:Uncharacterized protein n=1 Tax=Leucocoprinus birnbaumii TaxID=56174 RepID=A0AAD5VEZ1_9AGAR|nr:hypothetical protein NP233_g12870 [Leucocoprinus birnbaumii]
MGDKYLRLQVVPRFALPRTLARLIQCGHGPHLSAQSSQQMTPPFSKSVVQASVTDIAQASPLEHGHLIQKNQT